MLAPSVASGQNVKESFSGFAINMNSGPKTGRIDFTIERWSTDAEREQLLAILKEEKDSYKVNQQLLKALQKMPKVGYIRTSTSLAWDLHYARQNPLPDGGRRIVFATDRPIGFREAANQPRSMDYPFTVVEMQFDKDDKGVGKILLGNEDLHRQGQQPRARELRPAAGALQRNQEGEVTGWIGVSFERLPQ